MFIIEDGILTDYTGKDKSITIPDNVARIDDYAFSDCTGLTSVTIGNSVTNIGVGAFSGCAGLTSIIIPDSVNYIGDYSFRGCTGLTSITIPDSVTSIGYSAFEDCTGLTSITIPDSVTSIGSYAFSGCTGLTSITIPDSVRWIDEYAFSGCASLASIVIPNSVKYIGYDAFYSCKRLKTKKSIYKAFDLKNDKLFCRGYGFEEGRWSDEIKNTSICNRGYHYCENLFDIFNHYFGLIDKSIAIYECEAIGISDETHFDSKRVCQSIKPVKRLYQKDIIKILNGGNS